MTETQHVPARVMAWLRALPLEATRISVQAELPVAHPDKPGGGWVTCGSVDITPPSRDELGTPMLPPEAEAEAQGVSEGDPPHLDDETAEWLDTWSRDWPPVGRRVMTIFRNAAADSSKLRLRAFAGRTQVDMMTQQLGELAPDEGGPMPVASGISPALILEFMALQNQAIAGREQAASGMMGTVMEGAREMVGAMRELATAQAETIRLAASMEERSIEERAFDLAETWLTAKMGPGTQLSAPATAAPAELEDKRDQLATLLQELTPEQAAQLLRDPAIAPRLAAVAAAARRQAKT